MCSGAHVPRSLTPGSACFGVQISNLQRVRVEELWVQAWGRPLPVCIARQAPCNSLRLLLLPLLVFVGGGGDGVSSGEGPVGLTLRAQLPLTKPGLGDVSFRGDGRVFATGGWDGKVCARGGGCVSSGCALGGQVGAVGYAEGLPEAGAVGTGRV